MHGQRNIKK